jgi:hypothetical protein
MPEPNFFLIGAARSGTTALADAISRHPGGFMTDPKEPHHLAFAGCDVRFSGPGDAETMNRVAVTDPAGYNQLYASSSDCIARGDGSVSTLYYAERSIPVIIDRYPGARLVAILRDPIERAYSAFSYLRVRGFENEESFERALDLEDERVNAGWHHLWHYKRMGLYAQQLRPFLDRFPSEQILVLFYDDLERRPTEAIGRVFDFLGLEAYDRAAPSSVNVSGEVRSSAIQTVIRTAARQVTVRHVVRATLPFMIRERIRAMNLRRSSMPVSARERLREEFESDIHQLRGLLSGEGPPWLSQ